MKNKIVSKKTRKQAYFFSKRDKETKLFFINCLQKPILYDKWRQETGDKNPLRRVLSVSAFVSKGGGYWRIVL
ncbi:MAG: hypothetical protein HUJ63_06910 [Enterococcus sp.]|nr:hypothetical protein [Enterococcus sp.]